MTYWIDSDGTRVYRSGRYELNVKVQMTATVTVYARPDDTEEIQRQVESWKDDNTSYVIDLDDWEVEDYEEVE